MPIERVTSEAIWLAPMTALSLGLFGLGMVVGAPLGISAVTVLEGYAWRAVQVVPLFAQMVLIVFFARALLALDPHPVRSALERLRPALRSPEAWCAALAPILLVPVILSGFGALKMAMPIYAPFSWDDRLAAIDKALFFGVQPWTITHRLFSSYTATAFIDRLYTAWVVLLPFAILGFALIAPRYDRARFFLSFTAAWALLGVGGAYLLSSAGPCYAALVGSDFATDYAPLTERLRSLPGQDGSTFGAVGWQDVLWQAHIDRQYGLGMGISAMPSLHNAIAMLYALALSRFGRAAAAAGWLFVLITFIGSIHLGWHYATDGVVAGAMMAAIWWMAGRYLARAGYHPSPRGLGEEAKVASVRPALT